MGKRSNFKPHKLDAYATPEEAVLPLLPHLPKGSYYAEPCAGDGALIRILQKHGHKCVAAYDVEPRHKIVKQADASFLTREDMNRANLVITNPPWSRDVMHQIIERSLFWGPTWLLFDADWMHTKQATPYLPHCKKIVSVGRVKWFGNTAGKDNCCWYLFDFNDPQPTIFVGQ